VRPNWWVALGTPADCVRLAMLRIAPDVDWVFSGINHGGNLGVDVHMSGTVAAAREASLFGRRAVAFSHYLKKDRVPDWEFASRMVRASVQAILAERPREGYMNVNLPHVDSESELPEIRESFLAKEQFRFRVEESDGAVTIGSDYHARPRSAGSDVETCFGGAISLTRLTV
jgi:5'-nucleotidase